jgi:exopolysaccharide biosynthesis polyprenyl glycosylphosphotransferase
MSKAIPKSLLLYIFADFLAAFLAWTLFFYFRKSFLEYQQVNSFWIAIKSWNYVYGIIAIPPFWILLNALFDSYGNVYRMSRLSELMRTAYTVLLGSFILFFVLLLNDIHYYAEGYKGYYYAFFSLFSIQLIITLGFRLLILEWAKGRIRKGKIRFRTIMIGSSKIANDLHSDIISGRNARYYNFLGFVTVFDRPKTEFSVPLEKFPHLGKTDNLEKILEATKPDEVILALEPSESELTQKIINILSGRDILIKVIPDMYEILLGRVKMTNVYSEVLIEISPQFMPVWFSVVKRLIDITASMLVLTILSPLYLFVALKVRASSKGPIFYSQERSGLYGKSFLIYKFRSMYVDSEKEGPKLSQDNDDRCTPWGRIMRKYRLDEIPQFWNVLKGDMSLVGPRPERKFYLDQIAEKAPHVRHLLKVRPGITSWGQVKYGYASNVDEMIQRLKYDILYIDNISLALDIKILFYTVLVILQGRGK